MALLFSRESQLRYVRSCDRIDQDEAVQVSDIVEQALARAE
ncbi:MAG TPA: hypothetical protein VFK26_02535 [Gemmatimonadaceae bacterium]|nr:hypothetical protein [Gemmatimonadaceae bacterium]